MSVKHYSAKKKMGACYGSVRQTLNEISETTKGFIWKKN